MIRDKKLSKIKEDVLDYALDLWGLDDESKLDPVVALLLDVFAYEAYQLRGELDKSDSQLLGRLSRILVGQRWFLPFPAHGLMTVNPLEGEHKTCLNPEDHFFTEKVRQGAVGEQIFFTPLSSYPIVDARIHYALWGTELKVARRRRSEQLTFFTDAHRLTDYTLWIGLQISPTQLSKLDTLTLCLLPEDGYLAPFLRGVEVFDVIGHQLDVKPYRLEATNEEDHYAEEINAYYKDYYYQIERPTEGKLYSLSELFPQGNLEQDIDTETPCYWLRIVFPPIFNRERLGQVGVHMNTFPVVNRIMATRHHSFSSSGRIIPLSCRRETNFLNVHSLFDNAGDIYINRLKQYKKKAEGVFSLYFGELERFDIADARTQIAKVLQLIREEGNAFAAINPEGVSTQLKDLFEKLQTTEKSTYKLREAIEQVKVFLLAVPREGATHAELKYWQCQGERANGITPSNTVLQFNMDKYHPSGIRFQTTTLQGRHHEGEQDLVQSLRYGLLSRERIVSREDVKSYLRHCLGNYINKLEVKDGVAISTDIRKGIIRTTEILVSLQPETNFSIHNQDNFSRIAHFIEEELGRRSVGNTTYKVHFR